MLSLKSATPPEWLDRVRADVNTVLIDHAHCEKKAAGVALNLIFSYVDREPLVDELTPIVHEELEHFQLVRDLLRRRGADGRLRWPGR